MKVKLFARRLGSWIPAAIAVFSIIPLLVGPALVASAPGGSDPNSGEQIVGPGSVRTWESLPMAPLKTPQEGKEHPIGLEDPEELKNLKGKPPVSPTKETYLAEEDPSAGSRLAAKPLAPELISNFEAVDNSDQMDGFWHRPPDPVMAVGPGHVGVVVNSLVTFYRKDGTQVRQASLANWFSDVYTGQSPFDPRIVYDHYEGHWLMLALILDSARLQSWYLLSVSQTPDPTGAWWNYRLNGLLDYGGDTWADYPDLGFDGISSSDGGAVYITSNQFLFGSNFSRTAMLNILPKSALYAGSGLSYWRAWGRTNSDGSQAFTLRAAHTFGNPGGEFLINTKSFGWDRVTLWRVNPTYPPTPVDWTRQATISIGSYGPPPDAVQRGCSSTLSTIDNRMYNAIYRNGYLYASFAEAYDWGGGGGTVAAIRYLKVNTSTNSANLNSRFGADGYYYWFPAIYTDSSDNIVIVFARSSPTEYAGVHYTGRKTTDSSTQPSAQLKAGETCITGYRWGDYFGIANDPSSSNKVWIYGQWAKDIPGVPSDWDWGTWVGQVVFAGAGLPDLTVTSVTAPSSAELGQSISVTFTVKNQGSAASGPFSNRISLATTPWGTDISLGNFPMDSLGAGVSQTKTENVTIPQSVAPGNYYLTVFTDGLQQIPEADENNNIGSTNPNTISVTSVPGAQDSFCERIVVGRGSIASGDHTRLNANDGSYLGITSAFSWGTQNVDWYCEATILNPSQISGLSLTYDGRYSRSLTQRLYLYNFTTSSWQLIDTRTVGTSDVTVGPMTISNPGAYLSTEGKIRLRVAATAYTSTSFSAYGDYLKFTITAGSPPPAAPANFSGEALSTSSIRWTWNDNATDETGYSVHDPSHRDLSGNLGANATGWTETGLSANTAYIRHVSASNANGSAESGQATVYTLADVPSGLSSPSQGSTTITLQWSGNGTRYAIERAPDVASPGTWQYIVDWSHNLTSTTYQDTGLSPETTYWYRVRAYNGDGIVTEPTSPISGRTTAATPILQVTPTTLNFAAQEGGANPASQNVNIANTGSGTLNWTANKDANWITIDPNSGTAPTTMRVSVNIAGLGAGSYTGRITITGQAGTENSPQMVTVNLTLLPATRDSFCERIVMGRGSIASGDHTRLQANDGSYLGINSAFSWGTQNVDWYCEATILNPSQISGLSLAYDGRYSRSLTQRLYLYNFTTSSWVQIDSRTVGTSDVTVGPMTISNPGAYLSPEGEIRLRVAATAYTGISFFAYADYLKFTITTS